MTYRTVKLLADVTSPEDLFHDQGQGRPSVLDEYRPYLDDRWNQGCTKVCRSGHRTPALTLHRRRLDPAPPRIPLRRRTAPTQGRLTHCPELEALTGHVRSFAQILTERQGQRLPDWLDAVRQDALPGLHILAAGIDRNLAAVIAERQGQRLPDWLDAVRQDALPGLHTLAAGIDRDLAAVIAGLTLPWNSGVVEGHVNRIKMLKRQMFGRASFALLRKRVLLAP
ncbi:transposase [Streptomyces sp. NPDC008343]|uniref:transposase n=1 Tax=Streptomyces sp. NPDC008343 TaxID=3364828 RepID=UPI0036EBF4A3